jgi:hypothetical membrane protein
MSSVLRANKQQPSMKEKFFRLCGMIAPLLFGFTAILGGALRPGYSHKANTVSELFSPGSPNKPLLDTLHTSFAILLILFGVGVLQFIRGYERSRRIGTTGAWLLIAMGVLTVATATVFPQDPWGSAPTIPGRMHIILSGVITLLTIGAMSLIGIWFHRTGIKPWFKAYSFITIALVILTAGFFMTTMGSPIMGLAERITILAGFQWTFSLAWTLYFL